MSSIGFLGEVVVPTVCQLSIVYVLSVNSGTRCQRVLTTVTWLETLSLIFNSSLFLLRVIAIYDDSSRKVKAGFIFMWSTTFLAITGPFSARIDATSIGCNLNQVKPLGSPGFVAITIFDTLVFVAISAKVLKINSEWRFPGKSWIASFIHGDGLSHLSKVLLRSGQFYYLYVSLYHEVIVSSTDFVSARQLALMSSHLSRSSLPTRRFPLLSEQDPHSSA